MSMFEVCCAEIVRPRRRKTTITVDGLNAAEEMLSRVDLATEEVFGFTKGQFSLMELLVALLGITGPADVAISVWTAADADLRDAYSFIESGKINRLRLLIDRSFETRQPDYCGTVRELFGDDSVRVASTHAKMATICNEKWNLAIRTSMNLNRNRRWEQFEITNCSEMAGFINSIFDAAWGANAELGCPHHIAAEATNAPFEL